MCIHTEYLFLNGFSKETHLSPAECFLCMILRGFLGHIYFLILLLDLRLSSSPYTEGSKLQTQRTATRRAYDSGPGQDMVANLQ